MSITIDRRQLLALGGFGFAGLALPAGQAAAQALLTLTGFTHNVASGEPSSDSVLLWTRYKPPSGGEARVRVELSERDDFSRIVSGGEMVTGAWRDHTVKITAGGLDQDRWYWYRFIAPDGSKSPVGWTRTLPEGRVSRFNLAIFSCSNLGFGEFNAYGHAAARDDIDLLVHLGDYIYEQRRGGYDAGGPFAARLFPETELIALADYRLRYACYRLDPQLQALHAHAPMIASTDDHEGANDAWEGGAQNHQPGEGDWTMRKLAALQVWREWLPVSDAPWGLYRIGDLATYYRTDTRMLARSRPHSWGEVMRDGGGGTALTAFRYDGWQDDAATMMGSAQEQWLGGELSRSRTMWDVVGSGANMGFVSLPQQAMDWLAPNAPANYRSGLQAGIAAGRAGMPYNLDAWAGFPKARTRLLSAAQRADANLIVISGDSHNCWGFDLPTAGRAAGVEFGGHSVTSPGYDLITGRTDPGAVARGLVEANKAELRWMDSSNRGYMHLSLMPQAATNEWVFMETVKTKSLAIKPGHRMKVRSGRKVLEAA